MAYLLKGARLVDPRVELDGLGDVLVDGPRIVAVGPNLDSEAKALGAEVVDLSGKILAPGFIDIHVHLREPGFEYKETIESGCAAAAHGGFVGVASMANSKPVADEAGVIRFILNEADRVGLAHVWPFAAVSVGLSGERLTEMADLLDAGAVGFSDDGRGIQDAGTLRTAMDYCKQFDSFIASHAEDASLVGVGVVNEGDVSTRLGLPGQPAIGEYLAAIRDIELAGYTGSRIHICHVSSAATVDAIRAGKARGIAVTGEVTPHHLALTEDDITAEYETNLKMNPPLRTAADRAALIAALVDGTIDCVASDHAPHADHEKRVEFELAAYGTTGLETSIPIIYELLVKTGLLSLSQMVERMAHAPREVIGAAPVSLVAGASADLTIIDPDREVTANRSYFESKSANSAFLDRTFIGAASETMLGGRFTMRDGRVVR